MSKTTRNNVRITKEWNGSFVDGVLKVLPDDNVWVKTEKDVDGGYVVVSIVQPAAWGASKWYDDAGHLHKTDGAAWQNIAKSKVSTKYYIHGRELPKNVYEIVVKDSMCQKFMDDDMVWMKGFYNKFDYSVKHSIVTLRMGSDIASYCNGKLMESIVCHINGRPSTQKELDAALAMIKTSPYCDIRITKP
jgi:hypothetical protein